MQSGFSVGMIRTENARKAFPMRDYSTVENAGAMWSGIAIYDRILPVSPNYAGAVCRFILPGDIGKRFAYDFHAKDLQKSNITITIE